MVQLIFGGLKHKQQIAPYIYTYVPWEIVREKDNKYDVRIYEWSKEKIHDIEC